eukprot:gene11-275_t
MPPKKKEEKEAYSVELRFGKTKANLKMGIVGLPNVGKSSFFNRVTASGHAEAANFPFCTINPNEGRCQVPDERYTKLCAMWKPKSEVPAYLNITDIAGLVKGASAGEGLGNAFLSHIQAVDGIYHMVRVFEAEEVTHVDDCVDPVRDLNTITEELCLKDLAYWEKEYDAKKDIAKRANKKLPEIFVSTMDKVGDYLKSNQLIGKQTWSAIEVEKINETLPLLITAKP